MASLLFVLEPIELCVVLRPSDWASPWTKRGRELSDKGQAWLMQEPGPAVACWCKGTTLPPCLCDVWHGPLWLHTAYKPKPPPPPPLPVTHPDIPPHPHHPFMADPFSRSFRGPIKRLAHSVRSKMCNVRKKGGYRGRESWRGWDSKKAYNLLTKVDGAGPPILGKELLCRQCVSGIIPQEWQRGESQHGSTSHEKRSLIAIYWLWIL